MLAKPIAAFLAKYPDIFKLPRYTSYPTALAFTSKFTGLKFTKELARVSRDPALKFALYLHLPFCKERCLFCACHAYALRGDSLKNSLVVSTYLEFLQRELTLMRSILGERKLLLQIHLGGGTPTYLNLQDLAELWQSMRANFRIHETAEIAVEIDPRITTLEQLALLKELGVNRLSLGVQDFVTTVQNHIGRQQPLKQIGGLLAYARKLGINENNIDLVYGLPGQTPATFKQTLKILVKDFRPERIAIYPFAYMPKVLGKGHQRRLAASALPGDLTKVELWFLALEYLEAAGYQRIGMDHFALPDSLLARAAAADSLKRNFMGYTTMPATALLGAGISAISEIGTVFSQNVKKLKDYYELLRQGELPVERGYEKQAEDVLRGEIIQDLLCKFKIEAAYFEDRYQINFLKHFAQELNKLRPYIADGWCTLSSKGDIQVTESGQFFVRYLATCFDSYYVR